jgi:hypothetical protein
VDAAAIPAASRKMVQSLKGILADRSEGEIYATLCDCGMDPDIAVERLISQDTFHEVRRKRDKKKETKASQESRPRSFQKPMYRGYKAGSDRSGRGRLHFILCMEFVVFSVQPLSLFFQQHVNRLNGRFQRPYQERTRATCPT